MKKQLQTLSMLIALMGFVVFTHAQNVEISLEKSIVIALSNNKGLLSSKQQIERSKKLEGTAYSIDKTDIYYSFDQNNISPNNLALHVFGISQTVKFPSFYASQKKFLQQETQLAQLNYQIDENQLIKELTKAYYTISHWNEMVKSYIYLDSIYKKFADAALRKFELGESDKLEWLLAQSKSKEVSITLYHSQMNHEKSIVQFNKWIQSDTMYTIVSESLKNIPLIPLDTLNNPQLMYLLEKQKLSDDVLNLNQKSLLPDVKFSAFQGNNNGVLPNRYYGIQAGLAVPLFYGADRSKIQASRMGILIQQYEIENYTTKLSANYGALLTELMAYKSGVDYFNEYGKVLFDETVYNAKKAFEAGQIDYLQYVNLMDHANTIKVNYLQNDFFYNLTVIEANFIMN